MKIDANLIIFILAMVVCLIFLVLLANPCDAALPSNSVRRVAKKALAGHFGELQDWQEKGYSLLLQHGPAQEGRAYVTHYGPPKYVRGEATAHSYHCTEGCWAANSLPAYWYVLVQAPNGFWELGWVRDTGAAWNDAYWKQEARDVYGVEIDLWLDRWTPRASLTNVSWPTAYYVAISAERTW